MLCYKRNGCTDTPVMNVSGQAVIISLYTKEMIQQHTQTYQL